MESVMVGELGAVIEGDTATHTGGQWTEEISKSLHYRFSRLAGLTADAEQA